MRYLALLAVLALAACGSGSFGESAPSASEAPSTSASAASVASADEVEAAFGPSKVRQKGRYAPRDDCGKSPDAAAFRRSLAQALIKGDADAVAALASPDVKLGFGGDDGRARLLERLKDSDGELMREMRALLPLGCAVNGENALTMPWYFSQDMGDIDGYAATIVTGEDVPLYEKPNAESAVKRRISWDVVELNDGLYPDREFQLVTAGGAKGYMATAKLRSMLDYRLIADREKGQWRISAIVAGD